VPPVGAGAGAVVEPPAIAGATVTTTAAAMSRSVLVLINRERTARGVPALRVDTRLAALASDRADWMARHGQMSHVSAGGEILRAERSRGLRPSLAGECIGSTNAQWGSVAARYLFGAWRRSSAHWDLMMSPTFTLIGIGFGYRETTGETYGSLVFARP
jgi:uncharacterized protein YkwD